MMHTASTVSNSSLKNTQDGSSRLGGDGDTLRGEAGYEMPQQQQQQRHLQGSHLAEAFVAMNCMRLKGQLTDVLLLAGEQSLKAHRLVLAAASPYFHAMFNSE